MAGNRLRAFRYATSNRYRVPKGTHIHCHLVPANEMAGYLYQMPMASIVRTINKFIQQLSGGLFFSFLRFYPFCIIFFEKKFGGINFYPYLCCAITYKTMPTILDVFGLRFFFYSDEHEPIHVHVENSDGRAKFALDPTIELVKNEGMKPKDLKKAKALCKTFKEEFIEKWHEHID